MEKDNYINSLYSFLENPEIVSENTETDNWKGNNYYENERLKIVKDIKKCLDMFKE